MVTTWDGSGARLDQVLDRGLARDIKDSVDRPTGSGQDPRDHAVPVEHGGRPDLPQVVMVRLARGGDHPRASGDGHLHGDRTHAARAAVDEDRVAGVDAEQTKSTFTGLTGHTGRSRHRPIDRRRLARPGIKDRVLRLSVPATAQHLITHGDTRDPLADLVHHPGGVVTEITRADHRLAAGQDPGEGLPVDRVHAGRTHSDPDVPRARVRIRSVCPLEDLGTPKNRELQRTHPTVLPQGRVSRRFLNRATPAAQLLVRTKQPPDRSIPDEVSRMSLATAMGPRDCHELGTTRRAG